jgi:hypothetical protein
MNKKIVKNAFAAQKIEELVSGADGNTTYRGGSSKFNEIVKE